MSTRSPRRSALSRPPLLAPLAALAALAALALAPGAANADGPDGRTAAVGIVLGEPTGLTAKVFVADAHAIGVHAAIDFSDGGYAIYVDYLVHLWPFDSAEGVEFPFYFGVGGTLHVLADLADDDLALGARVPIGFAAHFEVGVEVFLEAGPGIRIIPATDFDISGGIGPRYYF